VVSEGGAQRTVTLTPRKSGAAATPRAR